MLRGQKAIENPTKAQGSVRDDLWQRGQFGRQLCKGQATGLRQQELPRQSYFGHEMGEIAWISIKFTDFSSISIEIPLNLL